ncbi:MAG: BBP7 family outer membrane beta-barrel protein [Thermoguttaceae bacterium]
MPKYSLLMVSIIPIFAIACAEATVADDDVDSVHVASDGNLAASADGVEKTAEPSSESSTAMGSAAKPQAIGPEKTLDGFLGCLSCCACPRVYGDVEALFLQQAPRFQNRPIVVDANTGATFQSTSDLSFDTDPGLRATFGVRLCGCRAVEFTYFSLFRDGASAVTEQTDPSSYLIFPNNFAGNVFGNGMSRIQTDYSSYVNSFELNFPCCCGCCGDCGCGECGCGETNCDGANCDDSGCAKAACGDVRCRSVEWFAGFRYLDIGNDLNIAAQRVEFGGVEDGTYTIHAGNRLFGGQIGGRLRRTVNRFGFELTGKAGIYDNAAEQTQTVIDYPNFPLRPTTSVQADNVAFVGEINLSAIFRLTNVWSVKAGYNVIWIEGLALAPDQLDFNFATSPSGNQLTNTGGMFLYGTNVGLEARW